MERSPPIGIVGMRLRKQEERHPCRKRVVVAEGPKFAPLRVQQNQQMVPDLDLFPFALQADVSFSLLHPSQPICSSSNLCLVWVMPGHAVSSDAVLPRACALPPPSSSAARAAAACRLVERRLRRHVPVPDPRPNLSIPRYCQRNLPVQFYEFYPIHLV